MDRNHKYVIASRERDRKAAIIRVEVRIPESQRDYILALAKRLREDAAYYPDK